MLLIIAELCKGSTIDSDSICLGSNPSSAAKVLKTKVFGTFYFSFELCFRVDKNHIILVNLESKKNEYLRNSDLLYKYIESSIIYRR